MEESKQETIVYVQSPTRILPSLSTSKNPMEFYTCKEDSSTAWYKLENAKPVKEYRCTQFDDYITKAESHPMEDLKHGLQQNATIGDFEFEIQEQDKELRSSEPISSKSTECDSSASNSEDPDSDEVSQPSAGVKRRKLNLNAELKTHNDHQSLNVDLKDQNAKGTDSKTGENLLPEVTSSSHLDPVYIEQQDGTEASLADVHLTVKAIHRADNAPFICLTSKLNGKTIIGYPLEIGELSDGSESSSPKKENVSRELFDDKGSRIHQLVWRTSKRTPVCYVTNSLSSTISKNVEAGKTSKNDEDLILPARRNGMFIKEKANTKQFNQAGLIRTYVSVELVFSKILAALGQ